MGTGTITIQGAKDKKITVRDSETTVEGIFGYYDGVGETTITINSDFSGSELTEKMYSSVTKEGEDVIVNAIDATQITKGITVHANSNVATSIKSGDGNDTLIGTSNDDTLIGGEGDDYISGYGGTNYLDGGLGTNTIVGGSGNDSLVSSDGTNFMTGGSGSDSFVFTSGAAIITDYKSGDDEIRFIASDTNVENSSISGSDVVLNIGSKGAITVQGAKGKTLTVVNEEAGTSDTRVFGYFDYLDTGDGAIITLTSTFTDSEIRDAVYGSYVSTIIASPVENTKGITIYANTRTEGEGTSIVGSAYGDKLIGAADKNDTLDGGLGDNTLTGTSGNNVFIHSGGRDYITDYSYSSDSGRQDTIVLSNAMISSATTDGKDVILYTDEGSITVKGAKDQLIRVVENSTDISTAEARIYGYYDIDKNDSNIVYLNPDFTGKFNAANSAPSATTIDGGNVTTPGGITIESGHSDEVGVKLVGSPQNDKLIAGGTTGDTLLGGEGIDTLTGGDGNDVFVYFAGNDIIENYTPGADAILLSATKLSDSTVNGKDIILNLSNGGTITVKSAKNSEITLVDSSDLNSSETRIFGYYSYGDPTTTIVVNSTFAEKALTPDMYGSETQVIDASNVAKAINITAGSNSPMTLLGSKNGDKLYADTSTNGAAAYIEGAAGSDFLTGGAGADTLAGGAGADTLEGKGGADVFVYVEGNDIIKDYVYSDEEQDLIYISDGTLSSSIVKNKDVVLNITKGKTTGTITVKNAKNTTLSVTDGTSTDTRVFGYYSYGEDSGTTIVINPTFAERTLTTDLYAENITNIDASSVSSGIAIEGNAQGNSIKGGNGADKLYGNEGNDVLDGGAGNDSISGGEGNDTLRYGPVLHRTFRR